MKRLGWICLSLAFVSSAIAGGSPLATLRLYNGAFIWIKVGGLPAASMKTLPKAKSFVLDVTISKDIPLKKDASGYQWFTFIVGDQGSDFKWNQTSKSGSVPVVGGTVKAGTYKIKVPIDGIPGSVLSSKSQSFNVGPATSGTSSRSTIIINSITGR